MSDSDLPFNEGLLLSTIGDRERAGRYVRAFAASLPEYRDSLVSAARDARLADLGELAHQVAGAAAYCGAAPLQAAATRLERAVAGGEREQVSAPLTDTLSRIDELLSLELERFV